MNHDQWKEDMHDGVVAAERLPFPIGFSMIEARALHKSIDAPIDPERMKDDTIFRTNGVCGVNKTERINGIAESFATLNQGRDGG